MFKPSKAPKPYNIQSKLIIKSVKKFLTDTENNFLFSAKKLKLDEKQLSEAIYIGNLNDEEVYALEIDNLSLENAGYTGAYQLIENSDEKSTQALLRSSQLLNWDKSSKFCGCCASPLHMSEKEFVKICESETPHRNYPSYSPSIAVLITNGDKILLARSPHFRKGMYSPLAGFIEAGESGESAVHREVMEEVGIKVKNIRITQTDSWPFPNTFMIGYIAEYESGKLELDPNEIEDAQWFSPDNLPILPYTFTLSYKLIQKTIQKIETNKQQSRKLLSADYPGQITIKQKTNKAKRFEGIFYSKAVVSCHRSPKKIKGDPSRKVLGYRGKVLPIAGLILFSGVAWFVKRKLSKI